MSFDILSTPTSDEQQSLERKLLNFYISFADLTPTERTETLALRSEQHIEYLHGGLRTLPPPFVSLDSSRPWLCYWILHSLALLEAPLRSDVSTSDVVAFLKQCQLPGGGYAGGPGQLPHLAPTYAAVATLVTIGGAEALSSIRRAEMVKFLELRCRAPSSGGGFQVCEGGEVDVRGCYTAMATAHMLDLDAQELAKKAAMVEYVQRCQTYEGGIGGEPGNEAHGGYTFCGLAALMLVDAAHVLDLPRLLNWATRCQGTIEGGFMGRTNKLVDGCYSFWQGGLFPLFQRLGPQYLAQTSIPRNPPRPLGTPLAAGHTQGIAPTAMSAPLSTAHDRLARAAKEVAPSPPEKCGGAVDSENQPKHAAAHTGDREKSGKSQRRVIVVPSFPVGRPRGIQQQAADAVAKAQDLADDAVQRAVAKEISLRKAPTEGDLQRRQQDAQTAVSAAADAQKAVQRALDREEITQACAAVLCETDAESARPSFIEDMEEQQGATGGAADTASQEASLPLYSVKALKLWVQLCCQAGKGGLRDKPGKPPDFYHTCYCLSGLSSAQYHGGLSLEEEDLLAEADPLCNVVTGKLAEARTYFASP